jgi:hypothetical protein
VRFVVGTLAAALVALGAPLSVAGAWDPAELEAIERARRIAVHAFGAQHLARAGDPETIPTLTDLGHGELPATAAALALLFGGPSDLVARLPNVLAGLLGALALHTLVARLASARAGLYASLVLLTSPLFALHARATHGQVFAMSAFVVAVLGLVDVVTEDAPRRRVLGAATFGVGAFAGAMTSGLAFGVAAPLVAVGAALVSFGERPEGGLPGPRRRGLALLAAGALVGFVFVWVAWSRAGTPEVLSRWVGAPLDVPAGRSATFDRTLRQLAHALFPWSALVPFALARMLAPPPRATPRRAEPRASFARLLLLASVGVGFVAHAAMVPWSGPTPFVAVAAVAGVVGLALDDLERGVAPSPAIALGSAVLGAVLYLDLARSPGRLLAAFSVDEAAHDAFVATPVALAASSCLWCLGVAAAFFDPRAHAARRSTSERLGVLHARALALGARLRELGRGIADAWGGNLLFSIVLLEAALVGLGAMLWLGRALAWPSILALPEVVSSFGRHAWWAVPSSLLGAAAAALALRGLLRAASLLLGVPRSRVAIVPAFVGAALFSTVAVPSELAKLSPRDALLALRRVAPDASLGVLGTDPAAAPHYLGREAESFRNPVQAHRWLVSSSAGSERSLVFRSEHLAALNAMHRRARGVQLPVLAAPSPGFMVASADSAGRATVNPLDRWIRDEAPVVARPVGAVLDDRVELTGWEMLDEHGRPVDAVVAKRPHTLRVVYTVRAPMPAGYRAFVHVDGQGRRHVGDHELFEGAYPTQHWQPGDVLVDEHSIELGANFLPGEYWLFLGLYAGDARLPVTEGDHRDDRVVAGRLQVR